MSNQKLAGPSTVSVELSSPVLIGGAIFTQLSLREPTVADQLAIESADTLALKEIALVARLGNVSEDVIKALTLRDYARVQETIQDFMSPPAPTTSAIPSSRSAGRRAGASRK